MGNVTRELGKLAARGAVAPDPAQEMLAARLDELIAGLSRKRALFRKNAQPRGLYIWGEVGRGKTLLMDLFFAAASGPKKRRVHFHAFMVEVHERLAQFRAARGQPIEALAEKIADETRLLCLDEMQVKDIADATILARLFTTLIARGTIIVVTSNIPPARLYEGGINRDLFLPFIALVEREMDVVRLDARTDYRLEKLAAAPVWTVPPDRAALDAAFLRLAGERRGAPESLRVQGRDLKIPEAAHGVARFSFAALCEAPLGPGDFGAIARSYHTVLIDGVPQLEVKSQDTVRRFILLIDELYDHRVKLIASAECMPDMLLTHGRQAADFKRTASRLFEMGSRDWFARPHGREADLKAALETD